MPEITDQPIKYMPFLNGRHTTAPALRPVTYEADRPESRVFQIDTAYGNYIENKRNLRKQQLEKYFQVERFSEKTAAAVCKFIIDRTLLENDQYFEAAETAGGTVLKNSLTNETIGYDGWYRYTDVGYRSLFDALCMQHQEDMAVLQLDGDNDWLAALHIFAPNFWKPEEKIGRDFSDVHEPVPDMEKVKKHYRPLMVHIIESEGIYERFGWGIASDNTLDHLEDRFGDSGRMGDRCQASEQDHTQARFIRIERQVLVGLRSAQALLFIIRTYFQPLEALRDEELLALKKAIMSMSDKMKKYKDIGNKMDNFLGKLS